MKYSLFTTCLLLFFISQTLAQKPTIIMLDELKYELQLTDEQKATYKPLLDDYLKTLKEGLDSLCKAYGHTFKKYDKNETGIVFTPEVVDMDVKFKKSVMKFKPNDTILFGYSTKTYHTNIPNHNGGSIDPIHLSHIEGKKLTQETKSFYTWGLGSSMGLWTAKNSLIIQKDSIKNNLSNKNLNIWVKKPKDLKNKNNEIIYVLLNNYFINKKYTNVYLDKPNLPKSYPVTTIEWELKEEGENYVFKIIPKGQNLILFYPSAEGKSIFETVKITKKAFDNGDYSEFAYLVHSAVNSFVIINK